MSGFFFYCRSPAVPDRWPASKGDTLYAGCKCIIRTLPFVHFIFTNLLQLCVVEESGIFGLWELVGGGSGGSYNFDSKSLYPEKLAAFAVRLRRSLCTQACLSLPEWQYFLDKMLWASYLLIKIAAVKEGDKITPLQEKVTDCLLLSLCFWSAEGFPREGKALQAHPGPRGPRLNRPSRGCREDTF